MPRAGRNPHDSAWLRAADAAYAVLLRLYPRAHRERWEPALRQAFRDRCREVARGERSVPALLAESLPDLAAGAAREQVQLAGVASVLRQHVAFALLLGFAATLWWRQPIAQALVFSGEAAAARWKDYRQERDEAAARLYWAGAAQDLEAAAGSGRRGAAALAWMTAGDAAHAGDALRAAIVGGDPAATWLAAVECAPAGECGAVAGTVDLDGALARQQAVEPGNAAPALFAFERAAAAGDAAAAEAAFDRAAGAGRYRAEDGTLMKALLGATDGKPVPARLRDALGIADPGDAAGELALDAWFAMPQPRFDALRARCRPGSDGGSDQRCPAIARLLAASAQPMARVTGQRLLCRYLCRRGPGRSRFAGRRLAMGPGPPASQHAGVARRARQGLARGRRARRSRRLPARDPRKRPAGHRAGRLSRPAGTARPIPLKSAAGPEESTAEPAKAPGGC